MAAANLLPTEIVQSILLFTNPDTFCSARLACSAWLHAASTAFMLRKALDHAPFPMPPIHLMTEEDWNRLFSQVAHLNLLGKRDHIAKTVSRRNFPAECGPSTSFQLSNDGRKLVVLKGSRVNVYDLKNNGGESTYEFSFARSLFPLWTSVFRTLAESGAGFFAFSERYARYHLAISSSGDVLALGLGKSIQIYDLNDNEGNGPFITPIQHILGVTESTSASTTTTPPADYTETDGVIRSIEFAENDTLLRVTLDKESNPHRPTRVRYMGNPMEARQWTGTKLDYWKVNLHRVYLDSAFLAACFQQGDNKTAFRGLRLLSNGSTSGMSTPSTTTASDTMINKHEREHKEEEQGRYFAAALHTSEIRGYCIGFVPDSDQQRVSVRKLFPSNTNSDNNNPQLNTTTTTTTTTGDRQKHNHNLSTLSTKDAHIVSTNLQLAKEQRWNPVNLPIVTAPIPILAVSDDGKLLIVFEPGAGHSYRFSSGGALYVYSLESCVPVTSNNDTTGAGAGTGAGNLNESNIIKPWSFLLDIVDVDIERLGVVRDDRVDSDPVTGLNTTRIGYSITATTAREVLSWRLA